MTTDVKHRFKKVIYRILYVLFIFICVGAISGLIRHSVTGEPNDIWGIKPVLIKTGSMEPTVLINSIVLVRKTHEISPGDILMYKTAANEYVVHRYIRKNPDGTYITKGDSNDIEDSISLKDSDIYGKVIVRFNIIAPLITSITSCCNHRTMI